MATRASMLFVSVLIFVAFHTGQTQPDDRPCKNIVCRAGFSGYCVPILQCHTKHWVKFHSNKLCPGYGEDHGCCYYYKVRKRPCIKRVIFPGQLDKYTKCEHAGPQDVFIMLDISSKIFPWEFSNAKKAINAFLNEIPIGSDSIRLGIIVYSNTAKILVHLKDNNTLDELKAVVSRIRQSRGRRSKPELALVKLRKAGFQHFNGDRNGVQNALIAFSSNPYGGSINRFVRLIRIFKKKHVTLYAVALHRAWFIAYEFPSNPKKNQFDGKVLAWIVCANVARVVPPTPPPVVGGSSCTRDLYIVIDNSDNALLDSIKQLAIGFINRLDVGNDDTRVGIISGVQILSHLKDDNTDAGLTQIVNDITFDSTKPRLETTLNKLLVDGFNVANGDRPDETNSVVFITCVRSGKQGLAQYKWNKLKSDGNVKIHVVSICKREGLVLKLLGPLPLMKIANVDAKTVFEQVCAI